MAQENVRRKANRSSCADIDPMSIDHDVGFEQIGGLRSFLDFYLLNLKFKY